MPHPVERGWLVIGLFLFVLLYMIGDILKNVTPVSNYQPSQEIIDITAGVQDDYAVGIRILQEPYVELNDRTIEADQNNGQLMFNAFVDESEVDINEAWKWKGTRSMARNKGVTMHAQLTANFILPLFIAQNEDDEEDRDMSEVMRDIIDWMAQPSNSNYQSSFLQIVYAMETNPVTYLGAEYNKVFQTIKEKSANGEMETSQILDEVLSGFNAPIWSATQVLISNAYERNIQKHKFNITRRYLDYSELEAKWGDHPNWQYVRAGYKSIYNDDDGLFYDVKEEDEIQTNLVAEESYRNRRDDIEIVFLGGIYMGDDNVDDNPIKHRDNRNAPKYNVTPFGYHRIGEHFFFYKSMMNALQWDDKLIDAMYEIAMNGEILQNEMPLAISGAEQINSEIVYPNAIISFKNPDAKVTPLLPPKNTRGLFDAMNEIERSMEDSSKIDSVRGGGRPEKDEKVGNVAIAQENAKINIRGVGRSLAESMIQYGDLMKDIAINNVTTAEIDELVGGVMKLKYRTFLLQNKTGSDKIADTKIKFDESLIGMKLTDKEKKEKGMKMLQDLVKKTGKGIDELKESIRLVNPDKFARLKYLTKIDIGQMLNKSPDFMRPVLMAMKAQFANDPFVDQQKLTRKVFQSVFDSEGDDLMKKNPLINGEQLPIDNQNVKNKVTNNIVSPVA